MKNLPTIFAKIFLLSFPSGDLDIDVAVEYIGATSPIITPVEGRIRFVESNRDPCESSSSSQTLAHSIWTVFFLVAANFYY